MTRSSLAIGLCALMLCAPAAHGFAPQEQAAPDLRAKTDPRAVGQTVVIELSAGFTPDPTTIPVAAGGWRPAENLSSGCVGVIGGEPDLELFYNAGDWPLYFRTESEGDTTLTVRTANGDWLCDDDRGGNMDAEVLVEEPISGAYHVWVGVFHGDPIPALLHVSELGSYASYEDEHGDHFDDGFEDSGLRPAPHLDAEFGSVNLVAGFHPDPFTRAVTAGGPIAAGFVSEGCSGMVAVAPSFELTYEAGGFPLVIQARSGADVTLMVNTPYGEWVCDDDGAGGTDSEVRFNRPLSGVYDIWVGVFHGEPADAVLSITETH